MRERDKVCVCVKEGVIECESVDERGGVCV